MSQRPDVWIAAFVAMATVAACGGPLPDDLDLDRETQAATFTRFTVDTTQAGPSFANVADLDGDGRPELLVSTFGKGGLGVPSGQVLAYRRGTSLGSWTRSTLVASSAGVKFPNDTTAADIDGDGDMDVIVPSGFLVCTAIPFGRPCGGLFWLERTPSAWVRHKVVAQGASLFYHRAHFVDWDGDGIRDLVTVGEDNRSSSAVPQWFKGTRTTDRFETTPRSMGAGLGSLPVVADIDGDGDLDLASAEYFYKGGSFAWLERTASPSASNPTGTFVRRVIDNGVGPSIELALVPNLIGDKVWRAVGTNHTNTAKSPPDPWESAVFSLTPGRDVRAPWTRARLSTGIKSRAGSAFSPQGAPGVFGTGDIDGDGDIDVLVSGDGDARVFWLEQTAPGRFTTHVLESSLGQAGGMKVADLDGDGRNELVVTGYESNAVYVYRRN